MTANGQEATSKWELKELGVSATIRGLPVITGGSREAEGTRTANRVCRITVTTWPSVTVGIRIYMSKEEEISPPIQCFSLT